MARNGGRKRERERERERALSNPSNPTTLPLSKRLRRALPLAPATIAALEGGGAASSSTVASAAAPSVVMVTGLPGDCTVLELKSRLEIYGPVARTRIDAADGAGYVTFRSAAASAAAVAASLDPFRGVAVRSKKGLNKKTFGRQAVNVGITEIRSNSIIHGVSCYSAVYNGSSGNYYSSSYFNCCGGLVTD